MMNASSELFGLYELDRTGTVRYSRAAAKNIVGLNFFDEIAAFDNIEEFRRRFRSFACGLDTTERFHFTCQFDEHSLPVKVSLTQISEREYDARERLIIVDIRKV